MLISGIKYDSDTTLLCRFKNWKQKVEAFLLCWLIYANLELLYIFLGKKLMVLYNFYDNC